MRSFSVHVRHFNIHMYMNMTMNIHIPMYMYVYIYIYVYFKMKHMCIYIYMICMDSEWYSMTRQRKPKLPLVYGYPVPSYGYLPRSGQMLTASWAQGANGFFPYTSCIQYMLCCIYLYICMCKTHRWRQFRKLSFPY